MTITERRIVYQDWYETECTKTGWDSHGWYFDDCGFTEYWTVVSHITTDKFGNTWVGIAEKETKIE